MELLGTVEALHRRDCVVFDKHLEIATYIGLFTSVASLLYIAQLLLRTVLFGNPVAGYPSLMAVTLFIGGVQMTMLGMVKVLAIRRCRASARFVCSSAPSPCSPRRSSSLRASACRPPPRVAAAGAVAAAAVGVSIADRAGTLSAAASRNWSPPVRRARPAARTADTWVDSTIKVLLDRETRYHHVFVVDDADTRYLRFDSLIQTGMWVKAPFRTRFRYTDFFSLALAYRPSARDVLFIGLGGGSAPKRLWRDFPQLGIQAVEIDPVVRDVAYRHFHLPRDPRSRSRSTTVAATWSATRTRRWDAILIDAFYADSIPFHLFTAEFLEQVREHLRPGGVVILNTIGATAGHDSQLERAISAPTARPSRRCCCTRSRCPGGQPDGVRNVMLVATDSPAPCREFLLRRWKEIRREHPSAPDLRSRSATASTARCTSTASRSSRTTTRRPTRCCCSTGAGAP